MFLICMPLLGGVEAYLSLTMGSFQLLNLRLRFSKLVRGFTRSPHGCLIHAVPEVIEDVIELTVISLLSHLHENSDGSPYAIKPTLLLVTQAVELDQLTQFLLDVADYADNCYSIT
jgi:hypothetical protein